MLVGTLTECFNTWGNMCCLASLMVLTSTFPFNGETVAPLFDGRYRGSSSRSSNRAQYLPERKKLMQDWADLLDAFKTQALSPQRAA